MTTKLVSPQQLKADLVRKGKTVADLAREHSVAYHVAYAVLSGNSKARRGAGHNLAVKLGLKDGEVAL